MDIHTWFNLSYCDYLVFDENATQGMPDSWHLQMAAMISDLRRAYRHLPQAAETLALAGEEHEFADLTAAQLRRWEVDTNDEFIHEACQCGPEPIPGDDEPEKDYRIRYNTWDDARWEHERDERRWGYRGEQYEADTRMVFPVETVQQARDAHRIVLNRTLLQSMPEPWQENFVELVTAVSNRGERDYDIRCYDARGHEISDPIPYYRRGRIHLEPQLALTAG